MAFFERHAWQVFAVLSVIIIFFGVGDMVTGGDTYREGEAVLFRSLTGTTWDELRVADPGLTALRRGQRWARSSS